MQKSTFRRLSSATLCVVATAAMTLGTTSTEAWGGKTTNWEITNSNSGKTTNWEVTGTSGRTTNWE